MAKASAKFVEAYLTTALWSSTDEQDRNLDDNYDIDDFSKKAIAEARKDCNNFVSLAHRELKASGSTDAQAGHDFWLTRNRHGAGFWDRGYDRAIGDKLTDWAHSMGEANIFVSRRKLHFA